MPLRINPGACQLMLDGETVDDTQVIRNGWRTVRNGFRGERGAVRRFGLRMFGSVVLVLVAVGLVGEIVVTSQLKRQQVHNYAVEQRADVQSFEEIGVRAGDPKSAVREVDEVIDAIGHRSGTINTFLVGPGGRVVAAYDDRSVGHRDHDRHVLAALDHGTIYAGHETDPRQDTRNFQFVSPVRLPGGTYALEVSFDRQQFDNNVSHVRRAIGLIGLLALLGGGVAFYLIGGRPLMRSHARSLQRATRDGLTDLPNQRAFADELPTAVAAATRFQEPLSLFALDVDDFKFINDKHGHPHGDAVLRRVAEQMRNGRASDRPYRTGGDEFSVMLPHTDADGATVLAHRLRRALADRDVTISIGVATMRAGQTAEGLRAEADAALYETKRRGGSGVTHFDEVRDLVAITTADKRDAVRRLIDEANISTVFQPIWDLSTETLIGVEALTRPDGRYGLTGPTEAFDIAEQIGRVHELDALCARHALDAAAALPDDVPLFINLSPMTLDLDAEGNDWFGLAVEHAGLSRDRVVVEVTERFGGRTASVVKALTRMRQDGFRVALDDVGTGNAGLEMLRRVGAEYVKIDASIVRAAATEPNARAVLLAMATFAHQTGSFVIAEGIEDLETLEFLSHIHEQETIVGQVIQGGQGFGLGLPATASPQMPSPFPHPVSVASL